MTTEISRERLIKRVRGNIEEFHALLSGANALVVPITAIEENLHLYELALSVLESENKQPEPVSEPYRLPAVSLQKAAAWLDRVIKQNPGMKEPVTCRAAIQALMSTPPAPVFRDLSTPIDPQIAEYELLMNATPLTTEEIERMEHMRLVLQIDPAVCELSGEAQRPKPDSIPATATISNINQICPPGVNQTEFAGGWNDSRHFALNHGTVPPESKGMGARALGWNACRYLMTPREANQHGR